MNDITREKCQAFVSERRRYVQQFINEIADVGVEIRDLEEEKQKLENNILFYELSIKYFVAGMNADAIEASNLSESEQLEAELKEQESQ